jgi:hypothetical protein
MRYKVYAWDLGSIHPLYSYTACSNYSMMVVRISVGFIETRYLREGERRGDGVYYQLEYLNTEVM